MAPIRSPGAGWLREKLLHILPADGSILRRKSSSEGLFLVHLLEVLENIVEVLLVHRLRLHKAILGTAPTMAKDRLLNP